jgi:hypothetical protein
MTDPALRGERYLAFGVVACGKGRLTERMAMAECNALSLSRSQLQAMTIISGVIYVVSILWRMPNACQNAVASPFSTVHITGGAPRARALRNPGEAEASRASCRQENLE